MNLLEKKTSERLERIAKLIGELTEKDFENLLSAVLRYVETQKETENEA